MFEMNFCYEQVIIKYMLLATAHDLIIVEMSRITKQTINKPQSRMKNHFSSLGDFLGSLSNFLETSKYTIGNTNEDATSNKVLKPSPIMPYLSIMSLLVGFPSTTPGIFSAICVLKKSAAIHKTFSTDNRCRAGFLPFHFKSQTSSSLFNLKHFREYFLAANKFR